MTTSTLMARAARHLLATALVTCAAMLVSAHAAETPTIADTAEIAFWWGNFDALEEQNARFRQPGAYDADGQSELSLFRKGVGRIFSNQVQHTEDYLQEVDRLTLEWATTHPASALAHSLHAQALSQHGWSYRGNGVSSQVTPDGWKQFEAYQRRAVAYLQAHADVAFTDSYAHLELLQIGRALQLNGTLLDTVLEQGLARNPDDIDVYVQRMITLLPKWGGTAKGLDNYIKQSAGQARARFGDGLYARLYSAAAEEEFGLALFTESNANWDTMKVGFDDLLARSPEKAWWRNRYAYVACLAKDKAVLQKQLAELGGAVNVEEWGYNGQRTVEGCKRLAGEP
jgi:hypothetical protein